MNISKKPLDKMLKRVSANSVLKLGKHMGGFLYVFNSINFDIVQNKKTLAFLRQYRIIINTLLFNPQKYLKGGKKNKVKRGGTIGEKCNNNDECDIGEYCDRNRTCTRELRVNLQQPLNQMIGQIGNNSTPEAINAITNLISTIGKMENDRELIRLKQNDQISVEESRRTILSQRHSRQLYRQMASSIQEAIFVTISIGVAYLSHIAGQRYLDELADATNELVEGVSDTTGEAIGKIVDSTSGITSYFPDFIKNFGTQTADIVGGFIGGVAETAYRSGSTSSRATGDIAVLSVAVIIGIFLYIIFVLLQNTGTLGYGLWSRKNNKDSDDGDSKLLEILAPTYGGANKNVDNLLKKMFSKSGGKVKPKKRSKKKKKSKKKVIRVESSVRSFRKHSGINKQTGRLKKGYKYSGKKLKSGLPQIIKIKKSKKSKK